MFEAAMLALVAVRAAWSGYAAAKWGADRLVAMIDNATASTRVASTIDDLDTTIKEIREAILVLESASGAGLRGRVLEVVADATEGLGFKPAVSFHGTVDREIALQLPILVPAGQFRSRFLAEDNNSISHSRAGGKPIAAVWSSCNGLSKW
jgi:hypothetical protein